MAKVNKRRNWSIPKNNTLKPLFQTPILFPTLPIPKYPNHEKAIAHPAAFSSIRLPPVLYSHQIHPHQSHLHRRPILQRLQKL
jgi:hypothetical protein